MKMLSTIDIRQLLKYVFTGGLSFAIEYSSFLLFASFMKIDYRLSNIASMLIALSINFYLNRRYVFMANGGLESSSVSTQFIKYIILLVFNIIASTAIIGLLVDREVEKYIAKLIAVMLVVSWTYLAYKLVIFKKNEIL